MKYLNEDGLQVVADKINTRLKTVTTMPLTAKPGAVRLYVGEDTADYKKGHIYKATGNYWYCYQTTSEEYIYIKNKFPPEVNDYFWTYLSEGLWIVPSDESQLEQTNVVTRVVSKGRVIGVDVPGYEINIRYPQYDINNLVWQDITASGGTVDLNFNPASENAQSGIAVSQALELFVNENTELVWEDKTWQGFNMLTGSNIWTDGTNIYHSYSSSQYVLNESTSTWEPKTWQGLSNFYGGNTWTDGDNIYYSRSSEQYVLDKETDTWEPKTWNGLTGFYGSYVWTDGSNIYYSDDYNHYTLNKETSTWESNSWTNEVYLYAPNIWTDGVNYYYTEGNSNKVLNKVTNTWEDKTWYGLNEFYGSRVWTDGNSIYYSDKYKNPHNYILNKITSTWEPLNWDKSFFGEDIWTDGDMIYCSGEDSGQLVCHRE